MIWTFFVKGISMFRNIVAMLSDKSVSSNFINIAANFAKSNNGKISGVYVSPLSKTMLSMPNVVDEKSLQKIANEVENKFNNSTKIKGVDGKWCYSESEEVGGAIIRESLYADLVLLGRSDCDYKTIDKVILTASCPVLLVPLSCVPKNEFRRILIAWKGTKESARALHDSLPLLHKADDVKVLTFGENPEEKKALLEYLFAHDIQASVEQHSLDNFPAEYRMSLDQDEIIGNRIIAFSHGENRDLIIMGGYGQSRLGDAVLSGVTHQMSRMSQIPIMYSH